mmetsp:Transcript_33178/g.32289  ORF Transcript_33178/g.32289 Transcript_33178/m.32289 type:complete len:115 (+) Transcript_33178:140-484(+)
MGCLILAFCINLWGLSNADVITASSTAALAMIFNCLLATTFLGEIFTRYDLISIILISMGSSLCVLMSNFQPKNYTVQELNEVYFSNKSILFQLILLSLLIIGFFSAYKIIKKI